MAAPHCSRLLITDRKRSPKEPTLLEQYMYLFKNTKYEYTELSGNPDTEHINIGSNIMQRLLPKYHN